MYERIRKHYRKVAGVSAAAIIGFVYLALIFWHPVPAVRACGDDVLGIVDVGEPYAHDSRAFGAAYNAGFLMHMARHNSTYEPYYEGALEWLKNTAERVGDPPYKYRWREYQGSSSPVYLPRNVAGIGYTFVQAYSETGDTSYLRVAKGVGDWLRLPTVVLESNYTGLSGYAWPLEWNRETAPGDTNIRYGWSYGVAGIGDFFFELWKASNDTANYLPYAKGAAEFLIATAEANGDTGHVGTEFWCAWPGARDTLKVPPYAADTLLNTQLCVGVAGIVGLFDSLEIYFPDDPVDYGKYGNGGRRWLILNAEKPDVGYCYWYIRPEEPCSVYAASRGKGNAYIGLMFLESARKVSNPPVDYLGYARLAANWLMSSARDGNPGKKWPKVFCDASNPPPECGDLSDTTLYITHQCMGNAGIPLFLVAMHDTMPNQGYGALAESSRVWFESLMVKDSTSWTYTFPWREDSIYARTGWTGVGGIGEMMYRAWCLDPENSAWLALADTAAQWLVAEAHHDPAFGGYKWPELNWAGPLEILSLTNETGTDTFSVGETLLYKVVGKNWRQSSVDSVRAWADVFGQEDSYHPTDKLRTLTVSPGEHTYPNLKFTFQEGDTLKTGEASFNFYVGFEGPGGRMFVMDQASFLIYYEAPE